MLPKYSPKIPSTESWSPPRKRIITIREVYPTGIWPAIKNSATNQTPYSKLSEDIAKPNRLAIRRGTFENDVIPETENSNNRSKLYFVAPEVRGGLTNATAVERKPT